MVVSLAVVGAEAFFSMFFLTLAACEGSLGLSLVVLIIRSYGRDNLNRLTILQC